MRRLPFLLAALSACPPPEPQDDCLRQLVDVFGNVSGGLAATGGGSGGPTNSTVVLAVVGQPITLSFFAPLTSCVSDTLRVEAVVSDPDTLRSPAMQVGALAQSGLSTVRADVTFTPTRPGLHVLKVAFEPSLGVRSRFVEVAIDGLSGAVTRVPIPAGVSRLWPLDSDTVACELTGLDDITLSSTTGTLTNFPGAQLVVAGRVLWSIEPVSSTLERRVFEDGGVRLTHSFPGFPAVPTPAMQDENLAIRFRATGQLSTVRITPHGDVRVDDRSFFARVDPPLAYYGEGSSALIRWSLEDCAFGTCVNVTDLAALDPEFVWRFQPASGLRGFERPSNLLDAPRALPHTPQPLRSPAAAFERLPLWLRTQSEDHQVLVTATDAGFQFTAWRGSEVVRVGREYVLLTDPDPAFVRVVEK